MSLRTVRFAALLLALWACDPAPAPATDASADRAAIEALNARWIEAYSTGDYGAIPPLYTEDALVMPRGRPAIQGRAGLARALGGLAGGRRVDIGFEIVELELMDDHAWLVSRFTVRYLDPATGEVAEEQHGRSLILYRRDADGQWRIHRDMDSPAPPP